MKTYTIATFNLHHGKVKGVRYSTKKLCNDVKSLNADIICLQEADVFAFRTFFRNQPRVIAKALGYHYCSKRVRFFGLGFQHNAILSKFPISKFHSFILPGPNEVQNRVALNAELKIDEELISISTSHLHTSGSLHSDNDIAINQLEVISKRHEHLDNHLIMGDLNLLPKYVLPVAEKGDYFAVHEYHTSPAHNPKNQIDWILAKGLTIDDATVSPQLCSDHRALIATLTI